MIRKEFLKTCGSICLGGSALSVLMQSCGSVHFASHTLEGDKIRVAKSEFTEIKKDKVVEHTFVVIRNQSVPFPISLYRNGEEMTALLMECTHQGCELSANDYSLVCPCHGSEFDTQGNVINPPAEKRLKQFHVSADDNQYYIHLT